MRAESLRPGQEEGREFPFVTISDRSRPAGRRSGRIPSGRPLPRPHPCRVLCGAAPPGTHRPGVGRPRRPRPHGPRPRTRTPRPPGRVRGHRAGAARARPHRTRRRRTRPLEAMGGPVARHPADGSPPRRAHARRRGPDTGSAPTPGHRPSLAVGAPRHGLPGRSGSPARLAPVHGSDLPTRRRPSDRPRPRLLLRRHRIRPPQPDVPPRTGGGGGRTPRASLPPRAARGDRRDHPDRAAPRRQPMAGPRHHPGHGIRRGRRTLVPAPPPTPPPN